MAKAQRFLAAAQDAFQQGHWETVASRAYYAGYHLIAALLETRANLSRKLWRAETLLRDFRERFTNAGYLFARRDSQAFDRLKNERYAADYEDALFNERRARRVLKDAEDLCNRLLEAVKDA